MCMHRVIPRILLFLALPITLGACNARLGGPPQAPGMAARITGTLGFQKAITLSPKATAHVGLYDRARLGENAAPLGEDKIINPGQQPIPFTIYYNPKAINPQHTYVVVAEVMDGNDGSYISTADNAVITQGHSSTVKVIMRNQKRTP